MGCLKVNPAVGARFPGYGCVAAFARRVRNNRSESASANDQAMEGVCKEVRRRFETAELSVEPHVAAWREAYKAFGAKPARHFSSVEALIRRVLQDGRLSSISPVVDAYNLVSLEHLIPLGGEDLDRLAGENTLQFSDGTLTFETMKMGEIVTEVPDRGEVVWADAKGITCRRWNWRQCARTMITETTQNAYFVFDVLPPFGMEQAFSAASHLGEELLRFCPNLEYQMEIVHRQSIG